MPNSSTSFHFYWNRSKHWLIWSVAVAVVSLWWSWFIKSSLPAALAGAALTLVGTPLTFSRLIKRGPAGSEDAPPPMFHPQEPGAKGVQFNVAYVHDGVRRIMENFHVINGIILLEVGTVLWGAAAPIMSAIWRK